MSIQTRKILQLTIRKCRESLVKASPNDVPFRNTSPRECIPRGVTSHFQIQKLSSSQPYPSFRNCSCRFYSSSHASSPPLPRPPHSRLDGSANFIGVLLLVGGGAAGYLYNQKKIQTKKLEDEGKEEEEEHLANWSGTHEVKTKVFYKPESIEELESLIKAAHTQGQRLRPVGSAISPNGLGLSSDGMVTLANLDQVVHVDPLSQRVRVQAGARVEQVVEALRPHNLTLQNYASVREQQIGGFIQVSAHGTGARIPPVDEQVVAFKLVTPAKGTIDVSAESDPALFHLARCALGTLGVVAEVTLQCVPAHRLLEHTFVTNAREVKKNHKQWLKRYQHIRYMWIPYRDAVVVVRSNPVKANEGLPPGREKMSEADKMTHVRSRWSQLTSMGEHLPPVTPESPHSPPPLPPSGAGTQPPALDPSVHSLKGMEDLGFSELRGYLLSLNPLDYHHVACVNKVEEEYWRLSEGYSIGWSDEILGFDCGGQQWVSEVCFPAEGPPRGWWGWARGWRSDRDLEYMGDVLNLIREQKIAAPAPIEQRWTASSRSPMSPAGSGDGKEVFSWVGIIMYLPTEVAKEREAITKAFFDYRWATTRALWDKYGAFEHWAKIEVPEDKMELEWVRSRLRKRFGVEELNKLRLELDPKNILGNDLVDALLPHTSVLPKVVDAGKRPAR